MAAFKKIEGRVVYIDMSKIHVPSWKVREVQKSAHEKTRLLKRIDPFARCVGRKRRFETPDQLKAACDAYFAAQEYTVLNRWGQPMIDPDTGKPVRSTKPLTISGLGRFIGLPSYSLKQYRAKAESGTVPYEFAEVVNEALQRIEEYAECRNYDRDGQRGAQFVLETGFNWSTKRERRERSKLSADKKIALAKLKMQQEKHDLEMQILKAGLAGEGDKDINITITRASREE